MKFIDILLVFIDLKDQMIRNTIIETEKDVQEIKEQQKEMREDVKNIERMMMQK